jgi:hypothetical protein
MPLRPFHTRRVANALLDLSTFIEAAGFALVTLALVVEIIARSLRRKTR